MPIKAIEPNALTLNLYGFFFAKFLFPFLDTDFDEFGSFWIADPLKNIIFSFLVKLITSNLSFKISSAFSGCFVKKGISFIIIEP